MSDIAIKVEKLGKRYRIGLREDRHDTFTGTLVSWLKSPFSNFKRLRSLSTFDENGEAADIIWALRDISFDVKQGEVVGIIGRNGAGKTTLLKVLSRITEPTSGRAVVRGRVASLLEVGTGFHPELTGRENVYLNGTVLGMSRREVGRRFDEIVAFSGVEKFSDTPVKRYSSGMQVRLAFAVAAHLEPEILLIDEVLAVGDAAFRRTVRYGDAWHPIRNRMDRFKDIEIPRLREIADEEGRAMPMLCPRVKIWLTDSPVTREDRMIGEGSLDQVHRDLAELEALGCSYVVLDTYPDDLETLGRNEKSWRMLSMVAETVLDLENQTVR